MNKDIRWLIIPDCHARSFWKEPVEQVLKETDAHITFLGDYLDPYPDEWEGFDNYKELAIKRFKDIIELKKQHPNRITLLIGNHDAGYCIGDDICSCRHDYRNEKEIYKLFTNNRELFQLAEETNINNKHIVFSHAGILKGWVERVWGDDMNREGFNIVDELNNAWLTDNYGILNSLGIYDLYRGWMGSRYGSPVWSDIRSWVHLNSEETFGYNIVGHTRCEKPVLLDTIAMLDVSKAFYLDSNGNIRDYITDEKPKEINKNDLDEED